MPSAIVSLSPSAVSKAQLPGSTLSLEGGTHSFPSSLPAGFRSKAYITTSEEADEVAKAIPVNRSIKVVSINIPCVFIL